MNFFTSIYAKERNSIFYIQQQKTENKKTRTFERTGKGKYTYGCLLYILSNHIYKSHKF